MASPGSVHTGQYRDDSIGKGYTESKFIRSPWEKIEVRERNQAPLTIWIGVSSVIVAIANQDLDPKDLEISVLGTHLQFRGTARNGHFSQDVNLPCAVEMHPIHITDGKGILYILLAKKHASDTLQAAGHGDKYPTVPERTMIRA